MILEKLRDPFEDNQVSQFTDKFIQQTNSDALICKCSAVRAKYLDDPFALALCTREFKCSPIMNRGTFVRTKTIDQIVLSFIQNFKESTVQILSLGAGSDTRFFNLIKRRHYKNIKYFEVDFAAVNAKKCNVIKRKKEFLSILDNPRIAIDISEIYSDDYFLLSEDLRNFKTKVMPKLITCGFTYTNPTIVLSECVLIYLDSIVGDAIISTLSSVLTTSCFVTYEQIKPHDAFGSVMIDNLKAKNISLLSIEKYPDLIAQKERYLSLGCDFSFCLDMYEVYQKMITEDEKERIAKLEIMDEIEEFILLLQHYCLLVASHNFNISDIIKI
ncbi:leucine carboxyl methyltransferase [Rozella allomycis CSF55]|uniref:Leucine carboxyl methyltransferase 1 n=1 Tax=Rozella allomycis (strain CSF55) TaxID=988480 RepID=A0A4P9YG45_ROZAC|nr:leucine carboxyl methyltransferase [Rozella allomycis CSF55]